MAFSSVRQGIVEILGEVARPLVGVTSLAAGADQVFAEEVLASGGSLYVVVPSRRYERSFDSPRALAAFERFLAAAKEIEHLDFHEPSETAYLAAGKRVVDLSDFLVAVWDGQPAKGLGGTADIVDYAQRCGKDVRVIWPTGVQR
jgi:hypothetical protein